MVVTGVLASVWSSGVELVVAVERVRGNAKIANARVSWQHGVEHRQRLSCAGTLVEDVRDRSRAGRSSHERIGDGAVEFGGTVTVEQLREPRGVTAEALAAQRERVEEGVGVLAGAAQEVALQRRPKSDPLRGGILTHAAA